MIDFIYKWLSLNTFKILLLYINIFIVKVFYLVIGLHLYLNINVLILKNIYNLYYNI